MLLLTARRRCRRADGADSADGADVADGEDGADGAADGADGADGAAASADTLSARTASIRMCSVGSAYACLNRSLNGKPSSCLDVGHRPVLPSPIFPAVRSTSSRTGCW